VTRDEWWRSAWATLPAQRNESDPDRRWHLDLQVAGPLAPLQQRLQAQGWRVQPQADWIGVLGMLDDDKAAARHPVLPATLEGHPEALLLLRTGESSDEVHALRLWPAPVRLADGTPLWLGSTQSLRYGRPLKMLGIWRPLANDGHAHAQLRTDLQGFAALEAPHPQSGRPVLRLRTGPATR
jgi:LssY-like putative type I secretion system component LssY